MRSQIIHPRYYEGVIDPNSCQMENLTHSDDFHVPQLSTTMVMNFRDSIGHTMLNSQKKPENRNRESFAVVARSGLSRIGVEIRKDLYEDVRPTDDALEVDINITPLYQGDQFFRTLMNVAKEKSPIHLGGVVLTPPDSRLEKIDVQTALDTDQLWLPPSTFINEDGSVDLPLQDPYYVMSEKNFNDVRIRRILREGKHALAGLQTEARGSMPSHIYPNEFFVGSTHISIGPYMVMIDPMGIVDGNQTPDLVHLAARVLHGVRTTGKGVPRQLELYNRGKEPIDTSRIKVRIRLYKADANTANVAQRVINERTLERGVSFDDLSDFEHNGMSFFSLMELVSAHRREDKAYGVLVGSGSAAYLNWQYDSDLQHDNTTDVVVPGFFADEISLRGAAIPPAARELADNILRNIGGEQNKAKLMATHGFPPPRIIHELLHRGIGVFMAHDLQQQDDAYEAEQKKGSAPNNLVFRGSLYEEFRSLEREGASLYAVMQDEVNELDGGSVIPAHIRKFHRGLFVRPGDIERMEKIDTIGAFYGSNSLDVLRPQLDRFMEKMKGLMGEKFAITHGRGPGVMLDSDWAAEKHDVFRIGVGIDARIKRQKMNPRPQAMAIFDDNDRLPRQRLMDDLSTFKIFSIGGAGTMEEAAISICSQKLLKNIPAPLIFVDPLNIVKNGSHLWSLLGEQVDLLAQKHVIPSEDPTKDDTNVRLLAGYIPNSLHFVSSYDEAFTLLQEYISDPLEYFKAIGIPAKDLQLAFLSAQKNFETTGFPWPHFIAKDLPDRLAALEA